jgi:regulator of chromosome condensation
MHTLVLTTRGHIYSFGTNDECTLGRTGQENVPDLVDLKIPMNGISCGDSHSIAYNTDLNVIYQWGVYKDKNGSMGQKITSPTLIDISNFRKMKIKKVVSGDNHTLVLAGGYVYAWGNPESGQIGRKPHGERYIQQSLMIQRLGSHPVLDVFAGKNHNFIICEQVRRTKSKKETRRVLRCWGHNHYGQLGLGHLEQSVFEQIENTFFSDKEIKHITGGESFTLVLTSTNELYGMGRNDDGQLGFENTQKDSEGKEIYTYSTPVKIETPKLDHVVSASNYSYGIDNESNIAYSWGVGQNYVLGNKSDDDQKSLFKIPTEFFKNKIIGQVIYL